MSGVLGFGVNRRSEQMSAVLACGALLADGGVLILSWNDRRLHYGVLEDALLALDFTTLPGLPPRLWVSRCDQQFAFLTRRPVTWPTVGIQSIVSASRHDCGSGVLTKAGASA